MSHSTSRRLFFQYVALQAANQAQRAIVTAVKTAHSLESQFGSNPAVPCSQCGKPFQRAGVGLVCPTCESEQKHQTLIQQIPIL